MHPLDRRATRRPLMAAPDLVGAFSGEDADEEERLLDPLEAELTFGAVEHFGPRRRRVPTRTA